MGPCNSENSQNEYDLIVLRKRFLHKDSVLVQNKTKTHKLLKQFPFSTECKTNRNGRQG